MNRNSVHRIDIRNVARVTPHFVFTPPFFNLVLCLSMVASAQSPPKHTPFTRENNAPTPENTTPRQIPLIVPQGTPIRVALSRRVRICAKAYADRSMATLSMLSINR